MHAFALLRDKARAMFAYNRTSLAAHLVGIVIVESMFATVTSLERRMAWGAVFGVLWLARVLLAWAWTRADPATTEAYRRWILWWDTGSLLTAVMWGTAAWVFWGDGDATRRIALVLVIYSYCVACVPVLAPQFRLFLTYVSLMFLPVIARVGLSMEMRDLQLALAMLLILGLTVLLGRNYRDAANSVLELKLRAERLSEQLRAEKAVSDAARLEAEVANRAKTQFFAAASHDLRQPLHAMSLFAEALRQRSHDGEVVELVNSINASVDALEGLFSELLDITRIDTGGVEVRPVDFAIADIFRKLRLHFEPTAFEKGLALRFRGQAHFVHADPLLVERILRNLVSNAIRYTEDGGVLVACRRRGERLLLQVWDTGPGIREAEKERIFEEFYQVPGAAAPMPHQKKGLGLGLAIVKRLAGLIGEPLALRSVPGHGSVFTLGLPVGKPVPRPGDSVPAMAPPGLTLDGQLIVVVEDEPAVRRGLEVLLKGWGAQVASFDSVAASDRWARQCDRQVTQPTLLIVDYRMEDGRTGVEAIAALRQALGRPVPAIMVTGSTMTGHEAEAERHDFHLLIKPVAPNKLRAMIGFKLGLR